MRNQSANQEFENNSMEVALEALGKSIARWTDKGDQPMTAIPGLSLYRRYEPSQPTSIMYEPRICTSYPMCSGCSWVSKTSRRQDF